MGWELLTVYACRRDGNLRAGVTADAVKIGELRVQQNSANCSHQSHNYSS